MKLTPVSMLASRSRVLRALKIAAYVSIFCVALAYSARIDLTFLAGDVASSTPASVVWKVGEENAEPYLDSCIEEIASKWISLKEEPSETKRIDRIRTEIPACTHIAAAQAVEAKCLSPEDLLSSVTLPEGFRPSRGSDNGTRDTVAAGAGYKILTGNGETIESIIFPGGRKAEVKKGNTRSELAITTCAGNTETYYLVPPSSDACVDPAVAVSQAKNLPEGFRKAGDVIFFPQNFLVKGKMQDKVTINPKVSAVVFEKIESATGGPHSKVRLKGYKMIKEAACENPPKEYEAVLEFPEAGTAMKAAAPAATVDKAKVCALTESQIRAFTKDDKKKLQASIGTKADGAWGDNSRAAFVTYCGQTVQKTTVTAGKTVIKKNSPECQAAVKAAQADSAATKDGNQRISQYNQDVREHDTKVLALRKQYPQCYGEGDQSPYAPDACRAALGDGFMVFTQLRDALSKSRIEITARKEALAQEVAQSKRLVEEVEKACGA